MTLEQQARSELAALPLFSSGEQIIELTDGDQHLRCELVALDSLACAFDRFMLTCERLKTHTPVQLGQVAEKLSKRLTYLLEPISPIEIDSEGCVVQMRSSPPQRLEDRTSYYELLISRHGEMSLRRYTSIPGQLRSMIPAQVTREVLLRLVGDFSAVVA